VKHVAKEENMDVRVHLVNLVGDSASVPNNEFGLDGIFSCEDIVVGNSTTGFQAEALAACVPLLRDTQQALLLGAYDRSDIPFAASTSSTLLSSRSIRSAVKSMICDMLGLAVGERPLVLPSTRHREVPPSRLASRLLFNRTLGQNSAAVSLMHAASPTQDSLSYAVQLSSAKLIDRLLSYAATITPAKSHILVASDTFCDPAANALLIDCFHRSSFPHHPAFVVPSIAHLGDVITRSLPHMHGASIVCNTSAMAAVTAALADSLHGKIGLVPTSYHQATVSKAHAGNSSPLLVDVTGSVGPASWNPTASCLAAAKVFAHLGREDASERLWSALRACHEDQTIASPRNGEGTTAGQGEELLTILLQKYDELEDHEESLQDNRTSMNHTHK
jgi:hypothetical protein